MSEKILLCRQNLALRIDLYFSREQNNDVKISVAKKDLYLIGVDTSFFHCYLSTKHPQVNFPHVLYIFDHPGAAATDQSVTKKEIQMALTNPNTLHIFSENPDTDCTPNDRYQFIPIGLESRTIENAALWIEITKTAKPTKQRKFKACISFACRNYQQAHTTQNRISAGTSAKRIGAGIETLRGISYWSRLDQANYLKLMAEYAFMLAPRGIALDTHRMWEALLMRCIPIVETSQLDPLFKDMPVVIVNSWDEITEEKLQEWLPIYAEKFWTTHGEIEPYLTVGYWLNKAPLL